MEIGHNVVGWFEIPVENMERAIKFYEAVFGFELSSNKMGSLDMAWFPWIEKGMGSAGSLVHSPGNYKPSSDGVLIYFTAFSGDVSIELERAKQNGGQILMEKTLISDDIGYMGLFLDTEGNRIALHARK
jgi:uncharacterized protein